MNVSPEILGIGAATLVVAVAAGVGIKRFFTTSSPNNTLSDNVVNPQYVSPYNADRYRDSSSTNDASASNSESDYVSARGSLSSNASTGGKRKSKRKRLNRKSKRR